ncbi:MAG: hypothetical protein QME49_08450 [bacterium]|nr:hypothetical protein [bacterium]
MKKMLGMIVLLLVVQMACFSLASADAAKKGGMTPAFASCLLGPRIGLELNEGTPIRTEEWINAFLFPIVPFEALDKNGMKGCLTSCLICPRAGLELKERKIRNVELAQLIPVVGIITRAMITLEAYEGKTMTEIEKAENLKK